MKRTLFAVFLLLVCLGLLGWAISQSAGYVLITYGRFRYESSFWVFLALVACLWLLAVFIRSLLDALYVSGRWVNPWSRHHRRRRAERASQQGLRELAEGQWNQALGHLQLAAEHERQPLVHYLGAARAASELGERETSEALLARAREREPDAALAIGLTEAQLCIARGEYEAARTTLGALHAQYPRHPYVLGLLQQLYVQLEDWRALCGLLPELRKQRVLPPARLDALERLAWIAAVERAGEPAVTAEGDPVVVLDQVWKSVPTALRNEPELVVAYAAGLRRLKAEARAEEVLRAALERRYDDRLADLYGQVQGRDPGRQLAQAEGWLKAHPDSPRLLLALGRLSVRQQLWGKARDYLEASLRFEQRPETCAELARVLAQLGESERSNRLYQEGLGLLEQGRPLPPVSLGG
ncbi:heme biosynthesis HemY N-terminal domain-containing protein [Stutzerimonas azotifigens]|uniref:heme biosynthesis HemY N-terminal domain-containing protein n=1 Tax=Stutzerimonas azotifigens TaxID=291995 RepID=UPI00040AB504|nr:heme biosynthesis HemY N-terminal domain-containing protein [Stutzerimonas azotifigens]